MISLRDFIILTLVLFFQTTLFAQNVSPQFSELKGMEDEQGNTHILYRVYSHQSSPNYDSGTNDIYNLVPGTSIDTIYLFDGYTCGPNMGWGSIVRAYDFWDNDLTKFIIAGELVNCFEPYFVISRFDSNFVYGDMFNDIFKIFITKQNDSLVFALPNLFSTDGGFNWDTLQIAHQLISVSPFDNAVYFSVDYTTSNLSALFKSTDSGINFSMVDTGSYYYGNIYYDSDGNHFYCSMSYGNPNYVLKMSPNQGNAFTWQSIYSTNYNFSIALDESQSGAIYLADGKGIFKSINYGNIFSLYKELDRNIIGIYKKPNSNKLYVATKYRIYEITDDTTTVIKSLPIPEEILAYYPLAVGNKWIYNYSFVDWNMGDDVDIYYREVLSEKIKANGKKYFEIFEKYVYLGFADTVYERIDSVEGKVYRYEEFCPNSEQFIEDLVMDVGDTTFAARFGYCIEHAGTDLSSEQYFNKWGIGGNRRNYKYVELVTADYFLATSIGLDYFRLSDDNGDKTFNLKGMLKNGIVYGDTTLTDIKDENELPKEFSLSQNYPNPFNPSTSIQYAIVRRQFVKLKVYDLLGREVATLVNEEKPAGLYNVQFSTNNLQLSSGVYFYQLKAGDYIANKKMIYLK